MVERKVSLYRVLYIVLFIGLAIALFSAIKDLRSSVTYIKNSNIKLDILILILSLITFIASTLSIVFLAVKKLKISRTFIVQLSANTMNRLLPAGIGALGILYDYLRKNKIKRSDSIATLAVNNLLGLLSGVVVLILFGLFGNLKLIRQVDFLRGKYFIYYSIFLIILIILILISPYGKRIIKAFKNIFSSIYAYRDRKSALFYSFIFQIALNLLNISALFLATKSIGVSLSFTAVAFLYNFAILFGTLIPAPGGVGSVDLGLVAVFILYGISSTSAIAIAILFRVLNMWVPFFLGIPALIYSKSKNYI